MNDIQKLRELLGLTQEELSERLGVSSRTIQNWEQGKKIPKTRVEILRKLASKFPDESFSFFDASDSPGAGLLNEVSGISSKDLQSILEEMRSQREEFISELRRKDKQIETLLEMLKKGND